jgi:hypothetical protein
MSTRQKSSLAQFLAKRSPDGCAFERAKAEEKPQSTPFFDPVGEGVSGTESFETVLTKITGPVDPATIAQFPTAQCLTREQVYDINSVGQEQHAHLATCPWCKNMMIAAQPSNEEFQKICRKAKSAAKAHLLMKWPLGDSECLLWRCSTIC